MDESIATDAVISLVPGWYYSRGGKLALTLEFGESPRTFYAVRNLTPEMWRLKEYAEQRSQVYENFSETYPRPIAIDIIQEDLAMKWLELTDPNIEWTKALAYFRELSERTYENATVIKHVIVTSKQDG